MERILVPYHFAERYPTAELPGLPGRVVTTEPIADFDADPWTFLGGLFDRVADAVAAAGGGQVVSADCLTSLGTVAGLQRAGIDPGVVWFDAHGDVQTLETSTSGYLGGLSLRLLLGYRPELIADRLGLRALRPDRALLVDARDLDPPEIEYLAAAPVRRVAVPDLTADAVPAGPLYLHVDLDVVDPGELPGLRFPTSTGPSTDSVLAALRRVVATGRVVALGLACTRLRGADTPPALRSRLAEFAALTD